MGRLNQLTEETTTGGRLSQLATTTLPPIPESKVQPEGVLGAGFGGAQMLARGELSLKEVIEQVPSATGKVFKGFADTFVPAITNFFQTTGSIFGEGLAYAIDENVRQQFKAGNLNVLPTISSTTPIDVVKTTIAAGIETAVYRSFPGIIKLKLLSRGGAGALQGVGFAISTGLAEDKSAEEIMGDLPLFGVSGGVLGVVSPYLLPLLKAELKQTPKEIKNIFKGLAEEIKPPKPVEIPVTSIDLPGVPQKVPIRTGKIEAKKPTVDAEPELRVTTVPKEQLPVGVGEVQVSRLEARVKGVLDDIKPENAEAAGIATFRRMNKADQIRKAVEFVEKDADEAMAVLRGDRNPPKGMLHNSIAIALEQKAALAQDANLAVKLASLRSTRAGQEISIPTEAELSTIKSIGS